MSKQPWYQNGLAFECTECGDCCSGDPGFVWLTPAEIKGLAKSQQLSVEEFEEKFVRVLGVRKSLIEHPNGDCIFLHPEQRNCMVYEDRPTQCKTWPFWKSNLEKPQDWKDTCAECPGCNRGEIVPLESIQQQLNATRM